MKSQIVLLLSLAMICASISGCSDESSDGVVAEGVIYAVEYETGGGHTEGLTRLNISQAVPGGNGSWNVNAYGKLYNNFLLIRFPDSLDLGYQAIPTHRLISVQFGDGGIKKVASQPKAN
jgi:hypothetical protein